MATKKIIISDRQTYHLEDSFEKTRLSTRGIVLDNEHHFLIEELSKYNFFTLPGGGANPEESPEETFVREVLEETGVTCEIVAVLPTVVELRYGFQTKQINYCYVAKKVEENNQNISLDRHEAKDGLNFKWYEASEGFQLILNQKPQTLQQSFLDTRDKAILQQALLKILPEVLTTKVESGPTLLSQTELVVVEE